MEEDKMNISEALTIKHKDQGKKPVNIFVGRFQPFTLGHTKVLQSLYNENKLPIVIFLIKGAKKKKDDSFRRPYSEELQIQMLNKLKKRYNIEEVIVLPSPAIDKMFNELRPKYEPVLWGTGSDRMTAYGYQVNNDKYREELNVRDDFSLFEIPRTGENISATQVRNAMLDNDLNLFKRLTPKEIHPMYNELKGILEDSMRADGLLESKKLYQPKKYVSLYEEFEINEFGPLAGSGNTSANDLGNIKREAAKKSERGESIYVVKDKRGRYKLSKHYEDGNTYAAYYNGMPQDLDESKVDESINSRVRSKIVVHLKRQGINHGEDYEYLGGEFIAKDIQTAQDIADAASDKYRVVIYDDRKMSGDRIPMMIVENAQRNLEPKETLEITKDEKSEDSDRMTRIQNNISMIKQDLETSSNSIEKLKFAIENGEKSTRTFEAMSALISYRNKLLLEYTSLTKQLNN